MNRVLVAGIGNIFLGDDGFGCEVVRRLDDGAPPDGVDVVDFGIGGVELGFALTDGYETAILVDTAERGGAPGTVYVVEPDVDAHAAETPAEPPIMPHGMDPARVLELVASLGARRPRVLLVACEPESFGGDDGRIGLSAAVAGAVETAADEVRTLAAAAASAAPGPRCASQPADLPPAGC